MSVPADDNIATKPCIENEDQLPPATPASMISGNSPGLAAVIDALGITSCKNATVAGVGIFPPFVAGASGSIGCEQIALLSGEMDAAQKVIQCAITNMKISKVTTGVQNCTINIEVDIEHVKCNFLFEQKSNIYVMNYTTMTSDVKQKIASSVETAMNGFIKSVEKQTESGLFPKSDGQKVVETMKQNLKTMIANSSITQIVQEQIEAYTNTGVINLKLTATTVIGNVHNISGQPCVKVTQGFVMQVLTQSIMQVSLEQLMEGTAKADLTQMLDNAQTQDLQGITPPSFGMSAVIVAVVIVALVLMFSKKPGGEGGESVLAGKVGTIFGSILLVIGAILAITGLVLLLRKKTNKILCYLLIIGGVILIVVAIVMIVKSRSQQLRFEQNLVVAKAQSVK